MDKKVRRPSDVDRTKFDKWLERMRDDLSPVRFEFAIPPMHELQGTAHTCSIIDVDRYMLLLEFADGETWWVSKSIITAAAIADKI